MTPNVLVSPIENAIDSLIRTARNLNNQGKMDSSALKGALSWGWHAVGLLFNLRILPHRDRFDQWVQDFFQESPEEIDLKIDIRRGGNSQLDILQILDFLSEVNLESLNLDFYQGWRDKATRCREIRTKVFGIMVESLDEPSRDKLLRLLAVHNRFSNVPSSISVDLDRATKDFPVLFDLLEMLWDKSWDQSEEAQKILSECRRALVS